MALTKIKLDSMITGTLPDANIPDTITIDVASAVPASGLTGATLASGVTASSLESVGTLTGLEIAGDFDTSENPSPSHTTSNKGILIAKEASGSYSINDLYGIDFSTANSAGGTNYNISAIYAEPTSTPYFNAGALHFLTNSGANGTTLVKRMTIDSSGNIGIGATPFNLYANYTGLTIGGNSILYSETGTQASASFRIAQNVREEVTTGDWTYVSTDEASVLNMGSGNFYFSTAPSGTANADATLTERMRITQAGKVGIGTSSPANKLHVSDAGQNTVMRIGNNGNYDQYIYFNGGNDWCVGMDYSDSNKFKISGHSSFAGTDDFLTIDTSGTSTFAGSITATGAITSKHYLEVKNTARAGIICNEATVTGAGSSNDLVIFAEGGSGQGEMHFMTGGSVTKVLTLDASNNATFAGSGIFGANGQFESALKVGGTNTNASSLLTLNTTLWGEPQINFHAYSNYNYTIGNYGTSAPKQFMLKTNDGSVVFATAGYNSVDVTFGGSVTENSDETLKDNVQTISGGLSKINQLRGVSYTRNDQWDKEKIRLGVIAQETEEVLPEVVTEDAKSGLKGVAYTNIVSVLIEAVKELSAKVTALENA